MEDAIQKSADYSDDEVFDDSALAANFENSIFKDNSLNKSYINNVLTSSALSCDREIIGFDKVTGKTWIYPTNYPVRDYQFNIIKAAILKNTLVSLPTGLGKTFIAAVIMLNFYRWYPMGKIIFTAPTKPLVAQQIDACYNIVAIPPADTVEMTGHMQVNTRKIQWETKRVFFATPQVIENDIKSGICPGDKIRCLVMDEAHKARGKYAYCNIISSLTNNGHSLYRVLALSATPGSKVEDVITIIKNLNIAHLELRTDTSKDVEPYCHSREIKTVIVELGPELTNLRQQYVEILDVYARRLKQLNILPQNVGNLSKGRIVMMYKEFQSRERGARHPNHNYIMKDFTFLIALYHGLELLVKHGSRIFLNFFDEHPEKSWIQSDQRLMAFLDKLRNDLGINPLSLDRSILPDGTIPQMPENLIFGHPKFDKLKEIMLRHFNEAKQQGKETKAIVFCEYRESVNLVHCLLLQCRPLIVPQMFVGQGASGKKAGASQKEQARALRGFRAGASNALVCTCVAEEGLDVGAVDLILCFDVSTRSPVRLVQRCGRTGRSRRGHVYILVTEGREHQVLLDSMRQRDGLNFNVLKSKEVEDSLYKHNPRMLPPGTFPECHKTFIKINKKDTTEKTTTKSKKGQKDLRAMLLDKGSGTSKSDHKELLTKDEFEELYSSGGGQAAYFPPPREYWAMSGEKLLTIRSDSKINLSTWLDKQRSLHTTALVGHSADTEILVKLLNHNKEDVPLADSQASYPVSLTPNVFLSPAKNKVKKKLKNPLVKSPFKKDGDIRAIFSTNTKSTKSYTKLINELGIHNDGRIPTKLINIFVDLSVENKNMTKTCWTCHNICDCKIIQRMRNERNVPFFLPANSEPYLPNISLIDNFDRDFLIEYHKTSLNNTLKDCDINNIDDKKNKVIENNLTSKCVLESDEENDINNTEPNKNVAVNFDIGDVEDIFADSSSEDVFANDVIEETDFEPQTKDATKNDDKGIEFFHLNSIDDLFVDSDSEADFNKDTGLKPPHAKTSDSSTFDVKPVKCDVQTINDRDNNQNVYPTSPSILSGKSIKNSAPASPILCSQTRKLNLSIKKNIRSSTPNNAKKQLDMSKTPDVIASPKQIPESCEQFKDISSKSMLTITQTLDYINKNKYNSTIDLSSSRRTLNESKGVHENERSSSPILLTQRDRRKNSHTTDFSALKASQINTSVVNLDSDSDSDFEINTQKLKIIEKQKTSKTEARSDNKFSPITQKSKLNDEDSPYFNKKLKLSKNRNDDATLQQKILAALNSNKFNNDPLGDKDSHVNFMVKSPLPFGKENKHNLENPKEDKDNYGTKNVAKLEMYENDINFKQSPQKEKFNNEIKSNIAKLQIYRRDSGVNGKKLVGTEPTNTSTPVNGMKRKLSFSDSDDDFECSQPRNKRVAIDVQLSSQKIIKKKKKNKNNEFLELEAELSGDASSSGDELSDDSAGSIRAFICDDSAAHDQDDMHAHYLKSVKSPVKGVFKIPQLPEKFNKREILSQTWVENDTYEMDSFCVDDSNVDLTQANEISELELAEMILEERRRKKRSSKYMTESQANGDSPLIRRKFRTVKKRIESDSDDSS